MYITGVRLWRGDLSRWIRATDRGYTGHEMLDNLGLIHMNGRVQHPKIGRFLSADPFVTEPGSTQGWNRYGYVSNNPLTFIDPSGFWCEEHRVTLPYSLGSGQSWVGTDIVRTCREVEEEVLVTATRLYDWLDAWLFQATLDLLPTDLLYSTGGTGGANPNEQPQVDSPPPCEEGPSSASGAGGLAVYAGGGGEGAAGLHNGRVFATGRAGFGFGGGLTYNPAGGLPVTPSANAPSGHQLNVSGRVALAVGIPFTNFGFSWQFELGPAYDSNDGFIMIKDFRAPIEPCIIT